MFSSSNKKFWHLYRLYIYIVVSNCTMVCFKQSWLFGKASVTFLCCNDIICHLKKQDFCRCPRESSNEGTGEPIPAVDFHGSQDYSNQQWRTRVMDEAIQRMFVCVTSRQALDGFGCLKFLVPTRWMTRHHHHFLEAGIQVVLPLFFLFLFVLSRNGWFTTSKKTRVDDLTLEIFLAALSAGW